MNDKEDQKESKFRVKDHRRFDMDGRERTEGSNIEKPQMTESASINIQNTDAVSGGSTRANGGEEETQIDFSSFVMSLATQALMQLGAVEVPEGVDMPVDKAAARQTIDLIALLKEKTKGNLDSAESRLIEEILHTLRLSFLQR